MGVGERKRKRSHTVAVATENTRLVVNVATEENSAVLTYLASPCNIFLRPSLSTLTLA